MPYFVKGLRDIKKNCLCFMGRKFFKSGVYLVSNSYQLIYGRVTRPKSRLFWGKKLIFFISDRKLHQK